MVKRSSAVAYLYEFDTRLDASERVTLSANHGTADSATRRRDAISVEMEV